MRKSDRPRCACGKPVWQGARSRYAPGRCWQCAEALIRAETVKRLTRSGVMAQMRRALEACPDAGRTKAERASPVSAATELARTLLVGMANAERDGQVDGEHAVSLIPVSGDGVLGGLTFNPNAGVWHSQANTLRSSRWERSARRSLSNQIRRDVRTSVLGTGTSKRTRSG
jgi:hypothetical protein